MACEFFTDDFLSGSDDNSALLIPGHLAGTADRFRIHLLNIPLLA